MASFVYDNAKELLMQGTLDLHGATDIKILLAMSNTTADTDTTVATISAFGTLDELNVGAGSYARQSMATLAVTQETGYGKWDADNVTFTSCTAGTRNVVGAVIYRNVSGDADATNIPIAYIDLGSFAANGSNIVITWSATGIINLT